MNDFCFKAQKEFDKAKQEFVTFPDNMCSQIILMNIKKPLRNINGYLCKIADIGDTKDS